MSDLKFTDLIDASIRSSLILLVAVLPWVSIPWFAMPGMHAKFTLLGIISVAILFLVSLRILLSPEVTIVRTRLDKVVLVFLAIVVISAIVSRNSHTFFGWDRHREGVFAFLTYAILFFAAVNFLKDERSFKTLIYAFLFGLGISNIQGFQQLLTAGSSYGNRVSASFVDPNTFSNYLLLMIPLSLASVFYLKTYTSKCLAGLLFLSSCFLLVFTFTRIAYVSALLATLIFLVFLLSQKRHKSFVLLLFIAGVVLAVAFVANYFLPLQSTSFFLQRTALSAFRQGWQDRLGLWKLGWNFAFDRPVFGYGPGSYRFATSNTGGYGGAHSEYLYYVVTIGWLGFLSFISILVFYFRDALRLLLAPGKYRFLIVGTLLSIMSYLIYVSSTYNLPYVASFFWLFLALTFVPQNLEGRLETRTLILKIPRSARTFLLVLSVLLFLFLLVEIARLPLSAIYWQRAVDNQNKGNTDEALINYAIASRLVPDSEIYLRAEARLALDSAYYENRINNLSTAIKNYQKIITELNKGESQVWFDLGEAYRLAGFKAKARDSYNKSLAFGAPVKAVEESLKALESEL